MSNDLLISAPIPQNSPNPSAGIGDQQKGAGGTDQFCKSTVVHGSVPGGGHDFFSTLKEFSQDQTSAEPSSKTPQAKFIENVIADPDPATEAAEIPTGVCELDHCHADVTIPSKTIAPTTVASQALSSDLDWDLTVFLKMLGGMEPGEKLDASDLQKVVQLNSADGYPLDAIKSWIAYLQSNSSMTLADLQRVLTDADAGRELRAKLGTGLPQTPPELKEFIVGLQNQKLNSGLPAVEVGTGTKPSASSAPDIGADHGTSGRSPDRGSGLTEFGSIQDPQKAAAATKLANKGNPDASSVIENPYRGAWTAGQKEQNHVGDDQSRSSLKSSATSDRSPSAANILADPPPSPIGQKPLAKVIQEAQQFKEAAVKAGTAVTEETVGKVIQSDVASHDNGQWRSSGQPAEKAGETGLLTKETETGQNEIRKQTLTQIVRKASVHLGNGQHEARIDLKPEYLGHIRMQVISENHQVTVKILAQHGFVRDMIESNVHQLKADMQQQGLVVDKLEVSVSHDAPDSGHTKQDLAQFSARRNHADSRDKDPPEEVPQAQKRPAQATRDGSVTIDFFA